jgi:hypothetical protein
MRPSTTDPKPASREVHPGAVAPFASKAIYGLLTVLALLLVFREHPPTALRGAITLFGTTLALALAEAYAEIAAEMLSQRRWLTAKERRAIGAAVSPVLLAAQVPTVILLIAAAGGFSVEVALSLGIWADFLLLFAFGLQVGRVAHQGGWMSVASGLLTVAFGGVIVLLKALFH